MKNFICVPIKGKITEEDLINAIEEIFTKVDVTQEQKIKDFNKRNYSIKIKKKTRRGVRNKLS